MNRLLFATMVAVLSLLVISFAAIERAGAGTPPLARNVSRTATDSLSPVAAVAGDTVHVAWIESEPTTDGLRATVWYVRSTDGGTTFGMPRPLAPLTGYASALQCEADGSTVHLAWLATSYTTGSPAAVDYQRSTDGGESFEPFVSVSGTTPPGAPTLVVSEGRVASVWQADDRMWTSISTDAGATFGAPAEIGSFAPLRVSSVRAASTADDIAVAWLVTDAGGVSRLRVGRVSWSTQEFVESASPESEAVREISAAASGTEVAVAWTTADLNRTAFVARSDDDGSTFGEAQALGPAAAIGSPRVAIGDDATYVSWLDSRGRLAVSRCSSDGLVDSVRVRSNKRAVFPEIVADAQGASIVWRSGQGEASVVRACTVGAVERTAVGTTIAKRGNSPAAPRLGLAGTKAIVVWQQLVSGAADIFVVSIDRKQETAHPKARRLVYADPR